MNVQTLASAKIFVIPNIQEMGALFLFLKYAKYKLAYDSCVQRELSFLSKKACSCSSLGMFFFFSIIFSFYLYGPSLLRLVICNFPSYFFMDVRFIDLCKKIE